MISVRSRIGRFQYRLIFLILGLVTVSRVYGRSYSGEYILKMKTERTVVEVLNEITLHQRLAVTIQTLKPLCQVPGGINSKRYALKKTTGLDRINFCEIESEIEPQNLLVLLNDLEDIEYAIENHVYRLHQSPNDSLYSQQWYLRQTKIDKAWTITRGSKDVLVAIIDTGIDYVHPDLASQIWINAGEDLNGNGFVDDGDFNNFDDDDNGYVDDIMGWDFTDAPHFPDDGDYLDRDDDPVDENGHGTSVAGVIAAVSDNAIGIAGTAPRCRLMNVRAGTSQGLLEEDDVASAIVYAVDNGVQIINLSFGDTYASPLLQDVIQYAFEANCVLIASAGNSGSADIHYPSGYSQTISVASTDEMNQKAGFSNYGTTVDLVAPGVDILSTRPGQRYDYFSGTSASAPIVSGISALILAHRPELRNETVRSLLLSSTQDLGEQGHDDQFGAGLVDAFMALNMDVLTHARIESPRLDQGFNGDEIAVTGDAFGAFMDTYQLFYGTGDNPGDWIVFAETNNRQVVADLLGRWDVQALPDTTYTIRLNVLNKNGTSIEDRVRIFIDRTPPRIGHVTTTEMIDGAEAGSLIQFETDDLCESSVFYRLLNSEGLFNEIKLAYRTDLHRFFFSSDDGDGEFEFFIEAVNNAGLSCRSDSSYTIRLTQQIVPTSTFTECDLELPAGYMLNKINDFNNNGYPEVVINKFDDNHKYGGLSVYEFDPNDIIELFHTDQILIPRDIADSDGDGLWEILAGSGPVSYILEATKSNPVPNTVVWSDDNDAWASRFSDLDRDGAMEIICRIDREYHILEHTEDNEYHDVAVLLNVSPGENGVGVPYVECGDFDNDGWSDVLFGDYDGDLIMYENRGDDVYVLSWTQRLPLMDCIDYIVSGDFNGDGISDFGAGCHSDPDLNAEHEYDARHWIYRIYESNEDDSYSPVYEQAFWGYDNPHRSANGVSAGDVDNDGLDELVINVFPDLYIIDFERQTGNYQMMWYYDSNYSQSNIIGDLNRDGVNELFLFDGTTIKSYYHVSDTHVGLPAPLGFRVFPLDTHAVRLQWNEVPQVSGYTIYKGSSAAELSVECATASNEFTDFRVSSDSVYWYAVAAYDHSSAEGRQTAAQSVRPGYKPFVVRINYIVPDQVQIEFSEPMNSSIKDIVNYSTMPDAGHPRSVIVSKSAQQVILTYDPFALSPVTYVLQVDHVFDQDGTPIDTMRRCGEFTPTVIAAAPYIVDARLIDHHTIEIEFNESVDINSAETLTNYSIEPDVDILSANRIEGREECVRLGLSHHRMRAIGKNYLLTVMNVKNLAGISIVRGVGDQKAFSLFNQDLSAVYTYPNPFRIGEGNGIMFANLTSEATITIYTIEGRFIRRIRETDGNGGVEWDVRDEDGIDVCSGVYLYYVEGEGDRCVGKLVIIR